VALIRKEHTAHRILVAIPVNYKLPSVILKIVGALLIELLSRKHDVVEVMSCGLAPGSPVSPSVDEARHTEERTTSEVLTQDFKLRHRVLKGIIHWRVRFHDEKRLARGGVLSAYHPGR